MKADSLMNSRTERGLDNCFRSTSQFADWRSGSNTNSGTTTSQFSQRKLPWNCGSDFSLSHVTIARTVAEVQLMPSGGAKLLASCPTTVPSRSKSSQRFGPDRTSNESPGVSEAMAR